MSVWVCGLGHACDGAGGIGGCSLAWSTPDPECILADVHKRMGAAWCLGVGFPARGPATQLGRKFLSSAWRFLGRHEHAVEGYLAKASESTSAPGRCCSGQLCKVSFSEFHR